MTIECMESALSSLEEAQENAGLGTGMMIQELIDDLEPIIERKRRIEEDE